MNGDLLQRAGRALYPDLGRNWRGPFAQAFMIHPRTLRRLQTDRQPVPPSLRADILATLRQRLVSDERHDTRQVIAEIEADIAKETQ